MAERDPLDGLLRSEVDERIRDGALNLAQESVSRSTADIVKANVVTRFNLILAVLLVVILFVAPIQDALFGLVMVANTAIGIVQELRAKRQLEQLAVVTAPTAEVIRERRKWSLPVTGIVQDDLVSISTGAQLAVDGVVEQANGLEVDESLLTGESDPVTKLVGDQVLSGSFVVAGAGLYTATGVGADAYAARLADEAREFTLVRSELRRGIDFILAAVSWALLPAVAILIWSQLAVTDGVRSALRNAVAGSVAMIPQGLVLVTSVAFAVGVVRLAQRRVLVQEMPAVEGLARVDVVCFDKTGTLTEGRLEHLATEPLAVADVDAVLAAMVETETNPNATIAALRPAYPNGPGWRQAGSVPFSSARKWSAVSFVGKGAFVIGAPDVLGVPQNLRSRVEKHASVGNRVLLLSSCPELPKADEPIGELEPLALVILGDKVRVDAPDTLEFFADQGVAVKVISGDHPATVGAIARLAGVPGADVVVDGRDLPADPALFADAVEKATVFGRISPRQKRAMIRALKLRGHVVAMSGDGVNDVLALKEADIGVAMGSGSDATKAVGQLVLVDGDFSALPRVVAEGRRVIANIERVANLYVTKTIYAFALVVAVGLAGFEFPFLPRHLTLVGSLTIPRRLATVGHIRVFAGLTSLGAATALSYSLLIDPLSWGVLRFVFGLSMSGLYVTMESWLNERATNETRGRLRSAYMLVVTIGLGLGPLLLGLDDPLDATLFILVGILISLAVVPVALIRIPTPSETIPVKFSVVSLARTAPLGVVAVAISGAAGSAVSTLGAVYATSVGMMPGLVGVFLAVSRSEERRVGKECRSRWSPYH